MIDSAIAAFVLETIVRHADPAQVIHLKPMFFCVSFNISGFEFSSGTSTTPGAVQQGPTDVAAWSLSHIHLSQVFVLVFVFVFVFVFV